MSVALDWAGVLSGRPLQWLGAGLAATVAVTLAGALLATAGAVALFALRIGPAAPGRWIAGALTELIRNSPLLVQMLFWYFAVYGLLPGAWRDWINADHPWAILPGRLALISPEFLTAAWSLGVFFSAFLAEELRSGLLAVSPGQAEAARAQGLGPADILRRVLLPQALANAWQPIVGQYLNLMKLSSLAAGIGLAELTYQVRQIESYNAHGFEAVAAGTLIYLALGLALGWILAAANPGRRARGA
jgi:polar amino acid transport system permease protein